MFENLVELLKIKQHEPTSNRIWMIQKGKPFLRH